MDQIMENEVNAFAESIGAKNIRDLNSLRFLSSYDPNWIYPPNFNRDNYFYINIDGEVVILVIKISRTPRPFWGVGRKYIEFFNNLFQIRWVLVLLQAENQGWVFCKDEIMWNLGQNIWKLRHKDDNYKINFNTLGESNKFSSMRTFRDLLNRSTNS